MTPQFRKLAVTLHITFSVGWLGAVVPYLTLAIAGLTNHDSQIVRAAYISMELIGWFVIVPLSIVALSTGFFLSLRTRLGLFRHWWIVAKFLLTTGAAIILFQHMQSVSRMSRIAAETTLTAADFSAERIQLVVHAAGGLLVLIAATALSVFRPWGMTSYGRRQVLAVALLARPREASFVQEAVSRSTQPSWTRILGYHAIGIFTLFAILHIIIGGVRHH